MAKVNKKNKIKENVTLEQPKGAASFLLPSKIYPIAIIFLFAIFFFPLLFGKAYLWEDVIEQHYPNTVFSVEAFSNGEIPHWTPYVFGGMPYMADMQTGIFYPPNWALFSIQSLVGSGGKVFIWFILLHILVFGLGTFHLARSFNISKEASLLAAISAMFSGFIGTHVIHIIFLYVIAWFPISFLFFKKALDTGDIKKLLIASIFFAISILGGYAQYTLFCLSILFSYTVYIIIINKDLPKIKLIGYMFLFGVFSTLAFALALIQYLPTLELSAESVRAKMTWETSIGGSLSIKGLLTLLAPKYYGWVSGNGGSQYWGGRGVHLFWETAIFCGISPFILIASAFPYIKKKKLFIFFSIVTLGGLLASLGNNGPLYYILFNFVPGFGSFRHPGRFAFIFTFGLAFLSAFSLNFFIRAAKDKISDFSKGLKYSIIASAILMVFLLISLSGLSGLNATQKACASSANTFAIISLLISLAIVIFLIKAKNKTIPSLLFIVFLFIELYSFSSSFGVANLKGIDAYPKNATYEQISDLSQKEPFRIQGRIFEGTGKGIRMFRHMNMGNVYKLNIVEGYNQLHLKRLSRLVHEIDPKKGMDLLNVRYRPSPDRKGLLEMPKGSFSSRFSLRTHIINADNGDDAINKINSLEFNALKSVVMESKPELNIIDNPEINIGNVKIINYTNNKIELQVNANTNSILFASESWYPAWKAKLDNKEVRVIKTNFLFRGIEIPKGNHKLVFYYSSNPFKIGKIISIISLLIIILLLATWKKLPIKITNNFLYMDRK